MKEHQRNIRFGNHIRRLRETKLLGVRELAREVSALLKGRGLSATYLSAIENGVKPPPRMKVLNALAQTLGASSFELEWVARGWRVTLLSQYLTGRTKYQPLLTRLEQGKATGHELLAVLSLLHDESALRHQKNWFVHFDQGSEVLIVTPAEDQDNNIETLKTNKEEFVSTAR